MEKQAQNIQEAFLNNARKDKTFLTIYLMSGVKLSGRIKSYDKYSVVLETNSQEQLIFKHAISTVAMGKTVHAHGDKPTMMTASAAAGATGPEPAAMPPPFAERALPAPPARQTAFARRRTSPYGPTSKAKRTPTRGSRSTTTKFETYTRRSWL